MDMQFDVAQTASFGEAFVGSPRLPGCESCEVRDRAICASLEAPERLALSRIGRRMTVKAGQTMIWEGDSSTLVANVIYGTLKLSTSTGDGHEQIVGVVLPSDFVGRPFRARAPYSVTALTDVRLCLYPRGAFESFARTCPALEHRLLQRTLDDLDRTRAWMLLLNRKNAREKVATFLFDIWHRTKVDGQATIQLPLSRQEIADVLGLTIETVSRQIGDLKRQGVIALVGRRGVRVCDAGRLESIADAEGY